MLCVVWIAEHDIWAGSIAPVDRPLGHGVFAGIITIGQAQNVRLLGLDR